VCAPAGFGKTSVLGEWAGRRLLRPFLRGYARRQIERLQLQPVKAEAEALARQRRRR
jgi:hypothetical protein